MNHQATPQEEALSILGEVISQLTSSPRDLETILRKCQHSCEILGWDSNREWFKQELNGYYSTSRLPSHRRLAGKRTWRPSGGAYKTINWESEAMVYGVDISVYEEEEDVLEVWAGVKWFISYAATGYTEMLAETKRVLSPSGRRDATLQRARVFPAHAIAATLAQIEAVTFDFASKAYVQLRYGSMLGELWTQYRTKIDSALVTLDLHKHLQAIESGLNSTNPEAWRSASLVCRNLLNDLADHLWRDPRPRYNHLKGCTKEHTLDVTQGRYANRIAAYLHQKGLSGTTSKFLRDEVNRLAASIRSLISLASKAHQPIDLQHAQSVAISAYILVGEIVTRTDLQPINEYGEPSLQEEDEGAS